MYGDLRDIHTIFKIDGVAAVLFLLPFTFMTYIGLTNMFTAIILSSFCDVSKDLNVYLANRKESLARRHHWIYRAGYAFKDFFGKVRS